MEDARQLDMDYSTTFIVMIKKEVSSEADEEPIQSRLRRHSVFSLGRPAP